ncbi:hypothetical protein ALP23_200038 [Pseudomonas syringae pv. apii]|uniref:Uncharacterized protein n=1 Tax=Pseudomonas syringae pv. apii TaxID=81036 RepID=A0A3M5WQ38_9PSED|nr:hypothetical protein ALP23_200038 [Pseudomonas syringae pv. apii]
MSELQGDVFNFLVFYLGLTDVSVHDGQLLLQRSDDQLMTAVLLGGGSEVFCRFLSIAARCFFALNIPPPQLVRTQ